MVNCPICGNSVSEATINLHIDSGCQDHIATPTSSTHNSNGKTNQAFSIFRTPTAKKSATVAPKSDKETSGPGLDGPPNRLTPKSPDQPSKKRLVTEQLIEDGKSQSSSGLDSSFEEPPAKRLKQLTALQRAAPLAERMRPQTLDDIYGQELVGPNGVLRGLIEADRVPSMILWGGAGTGKTTIARVIANIAGSRFVEINSTSSGVAECKKIFADAKAELGLTGRKTIIFCDEIHRFSKSQQDVFLGPVESGQITLIGATTENPSFKVQNALLSRCRTFTLKQLSTNDITIILERALEVEGPTYAPTPLVDNDLLKYLAAFAEGDARTALNLLELAMNLSTKPSATQESIKAALTKTLVYDRAGDQHCKFSFSLLLCCLIILFLIPSKRRHHLGSS